MQVLSGKPNQPDIARQLFVNEHATPLHLLVVDDDEIERERVRRYLAHCSIRFITHEATSSEAALHMVRTTPFDCVVLDNQLCDKRGSDLLTKLRIEACKDCPVIMITGEGSEASVVKALQDGYAEDYLPKRHLTQDCLLHSVMRSMRTYQLRRDLDDMHSQLERRLQDQATIIRQRERDLQNILDHAASLLGYWDASLRVRFGNLTHQNWFGVQADALPGMSVREAIGDNAYAIHHGHIHKALSGLPQLFEYTLPDRHNSALRHFQAEYKPDTDESGKVLGFYVSIIEVTQIRAAQTRVEELLRFVEAVIDNSPVGMAVYDHAGHCVLANMQMAVVTGMRLASLRQSPLSALGSPHSNHLLGEAQATLADGEPRHIELAMLRELDQPVQVAWWLVRVERRSGPHLLIIARDVTEQNQLNETLVNARDAAQEAARITSELLADMSHEIRTPMNAIVGLSRLALHEPLPPKARDYIERVHDSTQALMRILNDVLDYSKVEAAQMRLEQIEFDLESLLQRTADLFSGQVAQKRLHFDIALCPAVPTHAVGDPHRLSQILNNLVSNAIKFTDHGGICLTIKLHQDLLRFAVRDTGLGIAPEQLESLFVTFSQGDVSVHRRFGGTGLGLAICKKLVKMMKGEIGVDSRPGQGSEFWFSVPLPAVPHVSEPLPQYRVLLIGDDLESLGRRCQYLKAMNQTITVADSLEQACICIARSAEEHSAFDLVIMEWREVNVSIAHTLRTLRDQLRQHGAERVPLIHLLPGFDRQSMVDILGDKSSDVLLTQPVLPGALRRALRQMGDVAVAGPSDALPLDLLQQRGMPLRGRRVLLVEDNHLNQMVAQAFLQQAGLNVETVGDGDEAVRCMESTAPGYFNAILMDTHMPVMNGLEATRLIRQLPQAQNLPIIAMTAAVLPEDQELCRQAGMVDVVTKPILAEALVDTLLKWIRH